MDPITLFALANGAVSAVKAGCKLYKDIKGAAGDVHDVLKDLDAQFAKIHANKAPTVEQKNELTRKKNEVIQLNKKAMANEHTTVYQEIGEHLGTYYDNYYKCMAVFEEEERRSKTQVYTGEDSLGKRALQRVLMRKQLEQMSTELREIMVYQMPPELGALYTEVEEMMKIMGKQQKGLLAEQIQRENKLAQIRRARRRRMRDRMMWWGGGLFVVIFYIACMAVLIHNRHQEFPELGDGIFPERTSDYEKIVAQRNREYWEQREQEYRERQRKFIGHLKEP